MLQGTYSFGQVDSNYTFQWAVEVAAVSRRKQVEGTVQTATAFTPDVVFQPFVHRCAKYERDQRLFHVRQLLSRTYERHMAHAVGDLLADSLIITMPKFEQANPQ
jgi:hypothetical protein